MSGVSSVATSCSCRRTLYTFSPEPPLATTLPRVVTASACLATFRWHGAARRLWLLGQTDPRALVRILSLALFTPFFISFSV
jgi:hypothetical protein